MGTCHSSYSTTCTDSRTVLPLKAISRENRFFNVAYTYFNSNANEDKTFLQTSLLQIINCNYFRHSWLANVNLFSEKKHLLIQFSHTRSKCRTQVPRHQKYVINKICTTQTVSYTHLDVYKRQLYYRIN